jgi:hypothetical protein
VTRDVGPRSLHAAFDEARFGAGRTLNLREGLPTGAEARRRAEAWLRGKQVEHAGDVLIITGRGNSSPGHVPVVREEVRTLLASLRRRGVVDAVQEHTPGSFVVALAPLRRLFEAAPRRSGAGPARRVADPAALAGLAPPTRVRLRHLATLALEALGMRAAPPAFIEAEMQRQFAILSAATAGAAAETERRLADAIEQAIIEFEEV